jgi:iron-sulfur cluster repair protein YtfE (RIC family)
MATLERDSKGRFTDHESRNGGISAVKLGLAAAAGAAVGVVAMFGRKTAAQAPTIFAGDWPRALAMEHKAVLKIFDAIEATQSRAVAKRAMLLVQLKHALIKHAIEEENVVYPALRVAGQREGAEELIREHGDIKHFLYELENMPKNSPDFLAAIGSFRHEIEAHIEDEETRQFPELFASLSEEQNRKLTRAMNREGFKLA